MLLSIGMMVKNEEKYLDKCLSSLIPIIKSLDSELIIVDTGSTDNTIEIAKKYTDKVYFHKWNNNFSEMRNITLSYCTGDWFFQIDGDEILEDTDEILDFFQSKLYKKYNTATIYIKNLVDLNDETKYSVFPALRLFKKDKEFKFVNAVHNQPQFKQPVKILSTNCKHYGYISTDKELMEMKYKRTATILKNELEKDSENIYYLYQLSVSYSMHKDYDKAVSSILKAYDCLIKNGENANKYIYIFPELCLCYLNVGDYLSVEKYAKETLKYDKNLIDVYFYLGVASIELNKNSEAIASFESYLKLYENYYTKEKNISIIDYTLDKVDDVYFTMYKLNKDIKEYDKAQKYLLSINSSRWDIPSYMVELCISSKEYYRIKSYTEDLILKDKSEDINRLQNALENGNIVIEQEDKSELSKMFSSGDAPYNILSSIRVAFDDEKTVDINAINSLLEKIDLSSAPYYYGDLIYYMIYSKNNVANILSKLSFDKINEYLVYLINKYTEFNECVYEYILKFNNKADFDSVRINKELCRYLILFNKLEKNKMEDIYECYIQVSTSYTELVYSDFVLENECWQSLRTEEERFFVYMKKAKQYEESDKKGYFKYLNMALKAYPYMKDLIEYLLNKEQTQIPEKNSEFENYKIQVKDTIKALMANEKFDDAKSIIAEYESIVNDDIEVVLFKSQISLKELKIKANNGDSKYKM